MVILLAALLGNLTLLVLDPLTILFRTLTISLWPAMDQLVTLVEQGLYRIPWLQGSVAAFDDLVRPRLLPREPVDYRATLLFAGIFLAIVLLNLAAPRFWCRYLCPLGGLLGLLSKVALIRREVTANCSQCGLCAAACPTGAIRADRAFASDPGECTVCLECQAVCHRHGVNFPVHFSPAAWQAYDPNRRRALAAVGLAAVGVGLLHSDLAARQDDGQLIRPPGGRENNLLAKCIRCGACLRACPTGGLQPAVMEAGLAGLWTPLLSPRAGYCDYSCNACGQVCPVEAIPPLSLEDKRQQVIGLAYIDQNRCIAWAEGRDCIVCEEMCPVPDKAIVLEPAQALDAAGKPVTVQQPRVIRERCIGCGICEYRCPVGGEAAIRVLAPDAGETLY
jgi:MauM/NapG family ferredoxin protein